MKPSRIKFFTEATGEVFAELTGKNPKTAEKILRALPLEGTACRWGEEVYFETPVEAEEEEAVQDVEVGDVAYWPPGRAICIFFGRTPVSRGEKPRAYSPVNVFARVVGNPKLFSKVREGDRILVFRA
ncbi:MAG: cyclophilin-like fold protein [Candidatus Hadarchaeales archaeon]